MPAQSRCEGVFGVEKGFDLAQKAIELGTAFAHKKNAPGQRVGIEVKNLFG